MLNIFIKTSLLGAQSLTKSVLNWYFLPHKMQLSGSFKTPFFIIENAFKNLSDKKIKYYSDNIMGAMASQITCLTIVYSIVYTGAEQRKHHSSVSLAFVQGIHWRLVTRKMFPFDDVIMRKWYCVIILQLVQWDNTDFTWQASLFHKEEQ